MAGDSSTPPISCPSTTARSVTPPWENFLLQLDLEVTLPGDAGDQQFRVVIVWNCEIRLGPLLELLYSSGYRNRDPSDERVASVDFRGPIDALDTILRQAPCAR